MTVIPPRLIHIYCAPEGQHPQLPLFYKAAQSSARLLNPDFEYILFDRESMHDLLNREFSEYRQVFKSFQFAIQRYDFFRYLAIYHLGGFYLDLDVFLAQSLTPLLRYTSVFPFEELTLNDFLRRDLGMDWELGNYAFGAAPHNPFIKAVIDNCIRAQTDPDWALQSMRGIPKPFRKRFYTPIMTGPGMLTRTFAERVQLQRSITVLFPQDVGNRDTWRRFGDYGVHLMRSSWRERDGFFRRKLSDLWEDRRRRSLLKEDLLAGPGRSGAWNQVFSCSEAL